MYESMCMCKTIYLFMFCLFCFQYQVLYSYFSWSFFIFLLEFCTLKTVSDCLVTLEHMKVDTLTMMRLAALPK